MARTYEYKCQCKHLEVKWAEKAFYDKKPACAKCNAPFQRVWTSNVNIENLKNSH